ncbi:EamA family transporter RarD [Vibrio sp. 99-8-1]|uniref:EamA family transporter RarD n=1 Tax=Vibrio sp. 99-8-1 TaxID=2607602 RepID=UPI0014935EF3|nr:EamA family transporter RarD [Vibrio sp. 99-8-1]NOI64744.1 EamA family transporter RarD [Vibrio sp. 99-8-1]
MSKAAVGNLFSISAFFLWGLIPLYFQFIPQADVIELLSIRIVVSIALMLLLILFFTKSLKQVTAVFGDKKTLLLCFFAGAINTISLYSMTWALTNGDVLAVSLGYFINPILSVILGVLFLKDRLSLGQRVAVLLSVIGIGYQVYYYGELPWLSLVMAGAFALYGLIKKFIKLDSITTTLFELITLLPFALVVIWFGIEGQNSVLTSGDWQQLTWYIGAAPVTLLPLVLFAMAVERTTLTMIGLTQYLEPSLQFLLAVFIFGELFEQAKLVSFACIWLGLFLCTFEATLVKSGLWAKYSAIRASR